MIIQNIKINGFGKLDDKEYTFNKGINLITGPNECGKSTFVKCIQALLFGVSRNKNGKPISDYEKYKPWSNASFSAKIDYSLDNGEKYEVYRDFNKRNVKVFNSNLDDISANFSIDKNKNSNFFVEQTSVSEDIFSKTAIVPQQEVKLNRVEQNVILQKISNLVSTGNDTVSFKRLMDRLNRKQLDEVGTQRSSERPLNIVLNKIEECEFKLKNIDNIKSKEISMNDEIEHLKVDLKAKENEIALLKELQNIRNNERIDEGQINAIRKIVDEYDEKISAADEEILEIKAKNSTKRKVGIFIGILCVIFTIIFFALNLPMPVIAVSGVLLIFSLFFLFKQTPIPDTKTVLINAKKEKKEELNILISKFEQVRLSRNDYIRNKYGNSDFLNMSYEELSNKLIELEKGYSDERLRANTLTISSQNIGTQVEELADVEEELNSLNEELADLNFLNNSINIAKDALNEAYEEMKNSITPEFTNYLSDTISRISGGKYSQVRFNDIDGLIVGLENGDYINSELLSIGTIDEMYIALRIAALKETSNERLPIILDEAFVYFDNDRLKNILRFLANEFEQVIIFSCSNREKDLLKNMDIQFYEQKM